MLGQKVESPPAVEVMSPPQIAEVTILPPDEIPPSEDVLSGNILSPEAQVIITTEVETILPGTNLVTVRDNINNGLR